MTDGVYIFPTSFAQSRLWFLNRLEPDSPAYNSPVVIRFKGRLDAGALEQSLHQIVERHETLRTTFRTEGDQPVQVISPTHKLHVRTVYLAEMPEAEREAEAQRIIKEEAARPFNLAEGPLLRATLFELGADEHVLLLVMHHIVCDGWSIGLLFRELSSLYDAYSRNQDPALPRLPIQYADFAQWQREWLTGEVLDAQLSYWRERLADAPRVLELPTDRPRPAAQSFRGAMQSAPLPASLTHALQELSRREGVTVYMTLLAAFYALLARYTGQEDVLVGTPVANRNRAEIENLVGFFVNTLVLRTDLKGNPTFGELLKRVRETCVGAYAHQDVPFEKLVEELQPERSLSHTPLFQVMFTFNDSQAAHLKLSNLDATLAPEVVNGAAKFDLNLGVIWPAAEGNGAGARFEEEPTLKCAYNTDLFDEETVARLLQHYRRLLESALANPAQRLSELSLLSDDEQQQLLVEFNDTRTDYPRDLCIHELFEQQAARTPDAPALTCDGLTLTYRELDERAERLAAYLRSLGVGTESLVGVMLERSAEMVVALLAVLKAGGAYLPLDPSYPAERLSFMLEDTGAGVLLTQGGLEASLPGGTCGAMVVRLDEQREEFAGGVEEAARASRRVAPENLAYVMYTSGSTGRPKGVQVTHRNVVRLVKETGYAVFSPDEVFLQFAPISFDASTFELWGCLLNGARLFVMPPRQPSLEELGRALKEQRVSTLWLTASLFHLMVDEQLDSLASVRQLLAGGDVLSVPHVRKFLSATKGGTLINGYGPTESTTFACCRPMKAGAELLGSVPIGMPIKNTRVYVLDKHLQPTPLGVAGELYLGGDGLARGYLNCPELTAEKFIPDPFSTEPGARLYRTGDVARWLPSGEVEFMGRRDHQAKVRGFRVEPGEVEAALVSSPLVRHAVVLVETNGSAGARLVAYVTPSEGSEITSALLRDYLRGRLPDYMVPTSFAVLDEMPLTPSGKVDRLALRVTGAAARSSEVEYVEPSGETQQRMAGMWAELLGAERVGAHDNFFDLGGHSLLATVLVSSVRREFQLEVPLRVVFESPTVAELVEVIEREMERNTVPKPPAIVPIIRDACRIVSPAVLLLLEALSNEI